MRIAPEIPPEPSRRRGFTLIELLVVIAIIALLVGILLPAIGRARGTARSVVCLSRMRSLAQVAVMHADEHQGELPRSTHSAGFNRLPWSAVLFEALTDSPFLGDSTAWDNDAWWNATDTFYRCPHDGRRGPQFQNGLPFGLPAYSYGLNAYYELRREEIDPDRHAGDRSEPWRSVDRVPMPTRTVLFGELPESSRIDHVMAHFWRTRGVPAGDGVATDRHGDGSGYVFLDTHAETSVFADTFDMNEGLDRWDPDPTKK